MTSNKVKRLCLMPSLISLLSGCAAIKEPTPSEIAFKRPLPEYPRTTASRTAAIKYRYGEPYDSEDGTSLPGEPVFCNRNGVFKMSEEYKFTQQILVPADETVAASVVISWFNSGWQKTCWPLVAFKPEAGKTYAVVNERIGGKGISKLWTGVALQSCRVSIFEETPTGPNRVPVFPPNFQCQ